MGYTVEYQELVAADYGAPTTRKRFVLVARCDGRPLRVILNQRRRKKDLIPRRGDGMYRRCYLAPH